MVTACLATKILQSARHRFIQTQATVNLLQQQHAAIRGNIATLEIGLNTTQ